MKKLFSFLSLVVLVGALLIPANFASANKKAAVRSVPIKSTKQVNKVKEKKKKMPYVSAKNNKHWWLKLPASGKRAAILSPKQRRMAEEREAKEEERERQILAAQGAILPQAVSSPALQSPEVSATPLSSTTSQGA